LVCQTRPSSFSIQMVPGRVLTRPSAHLARTGASDQIRMAAYNIAFQPLPLRGGSLGLRSSGRLNAGVAGHDERTTTEEWMAASARKTALTRKRKAAAKKAAITRKRRAAGKKAATTRKRRTAGRKAATTRKRRASAAKAVATRRARAAAAVEPAARPSPVGAAPSAASLQPTDSVPKLPEQL
jgi:hypothetical protein